MDEERYLAYSSEEENVDERTPMTISVLRRNPFQWTTKAFIPKIHEFDDTNSGCKIQGEFAGFDENEPTSRSGGKGIVIKYLKDSYNYKNLILIGDGATDLEACPPADAFIGYGGNIIRPIVKAKAKWFVTDFNEIMNAILEF